jgi:hypothetical protein
MRMDESSDAEVGLVLHDQPEDEKQASENHTAHAEDDVQSPAMHEELLVS